MMLEFQIALLIVGGSVCLAGLYNWLIRPNPIKLSDLKYDPNKHRINKKEKALLSDLVKDMQKNPGHWVKNAYSPITFKGPIIVNDYSCIGIVFSQHSDQPETVAILFNINNDTKFKQEDENTIATRVSGKHAKKFINTVTRIMDERGKELDYFRSRIKERL